LGYTIPQRCARRPAPFGRSLEVSDKEKEIPLRYLDRRVVERYLKKGLLDEKEYARYLKSLDDLAEKAGSVETEFTSIGELGPTR
jgi:hypothetical protein